MYRGHDDLIGFHGTPQFLLILLACVSNRKRQDTTFSLNQDFVALQSWTNCLKFGDSVEDCRKL